MTLTLLLVYLHDIRGFTVTFGGFLLSYQAVIAIAATGPVGALIDRIGPKKILIAGLLIESISVFGWSIVTTHTRAIIIATAMALGLTCIWPPQMVIIARLSKPEVRQRLYGLYFMLFNLGLGLAMGANTMVIFFLQATVLQIISQRNKILMLASVGIIWGLSWIVVGSAALFVGAVAGLMVVLSQVIFAIGEMIWAPTFPTVVNDFAPDHLRGRYNAILGLQWNMAGVVGPAIAGTLLGYDLQIFWVVLMVLGSVIPVALFAQLRHKN